MGGTATGMGAGAMTETDTIANERILRVREIDPRVRHQVILQLFENLDADGSLQLVVDHDPKPLRHQLEMRYGAACGWTYLEAGPDLWRVRLRNGGENRA